MLLLILFSNLVSKLVDNADNDVVVCNLLPLLSSAVTMVTLFGSNVGLHMANAGFECKPTFLGHMATMLAPIGPMWRMRSLIVRDGGGGEKI